MQIIDKTGRIGDVTEIRPYGVFAKPAGVPYEVFDNGHVTGVQGSTLIMATFWSLLPDGSYRGIWADSPHGQFVSARQALPTDS